MRTEVEGINRAERKILLSLDFEARGPPFAPLPERRPLDMEGGAQALGAAAGAPLPPFARPLGLVSSVGGARRTQPRV